MLGKGRPNVWVYDRYASNAPSYHIYNNYSHGSWKVFLVYTSHFLCLSITPLLVVHWGFLFLRIWGIITIRTMVSRIPFMTMSSRPWVWDDIAFTSGNGLDPVGQDRWFLIKSLLFCLATRKHDINSEYFVNQCFGYCCCKSISKAWNVVKVFFNMSTSMIFFLHTALIES